MKNVRRIMVTGLVVGISGLALSACGSSAGPTYNGGNGQSGSTTSTTSTTTPSTTSTTTPPTGAGSGSTTTPVPNVPGSVPVSADHAALGVVSDFVTKFWAVSPTWSSPGESVDFVRPYVTPGVYSQLYGPAHAPLTASALVAWDQNVRLGIGYSVSKPYAWIVTDAGVFPSTCVVEVEFYTVQTQNGTPLVGRVNNLKYAFQMTKIKGRWYVASPPEPGQ